MKDDFVALAVMQGWLIKPQGPRQDIKKPGRREQGRRSPQVLIGPDPSRGRRDCPLAHLRALLASTRAAHPHFWCRSSAAKTGISLRTNGLLAWPLATGVTHD